MLKTKTRSRKSSSQTSVIRLSRSTVDVLRQKSRQHRLSMRAYIDRLVNSVDESLVETIQDTIAAERLLDFTRDPKQMKQLVSCADLCKELNIQPRQKKAIKA